MPAKTVVCNICGDEVSKRKSLAFGDGRACRQHDEVVQALEEQKRKLQEQRALQNYKEEGKRLDREIHENMQMIALGAYIRVQHSVHGIPVDRLYNLLSIVHGKKKMDKVMDQLNAGGGPYTDPEELISNALYLSMAMDKHKKGNEK